MDGSTLELSSVNNTKNGFLVKITDSDKCVNCILCIVSS